MKIAIIQCAPVLGNLELTITRMGKHMDQLEECDLVIFPELANSGYHFKNREEAFRLAESINESRFIRFLESRCREKSMYAVTGFNEREGDHIYSSSVLAGPRGIIGKYRKLHLFWNEKDYFTPGNVGLPVFDIGMCRMGMLVCFDWIFPEVWRILALKGADLICHPSNIVLPFAQQVIPSYAIINRVFIALANRIGEERGLTFTGKSLLVDPSGKVLNLASENQEQVMVTEIDPMLARNKQITPRNDIFSDRLPQAYTELLD